MFYNCWVFQLTRQCSGFLEVKNGAYCSISELLCYVIFNMIAYLGACLPDAVSPANGSVVARFAGSEDQVQLNCNIVCDGTRQPATWTLENYMKMDKEVFILNGNIPNITVTGDPRSDTGTRTFRNTLIIHQFAEELSGTVLRCKFSDFIAVFFLETYSKTSYCDHWVVFLFQLPRRIVILLQ